MRNPTWRDLAVLTVCGALQIACIAGVINAPIPAAIAGAATYRDSDGSLVQATAQAGTFGADHSANQPSLPNVGANFGATGPYANYVLIATVAANPARFNIDIENTSGAQIAIIRDDGTAAGGSAPANASVFALGGGSASGAQGGSWNSMTFKGRLQIYAASSSAIVAAFTD